MELYSSPVKGHFWKSWKKVLEFVENSCFENLVSLIDLRPFISCLQIWLQNPEQIWVWISQENPLRIFSIRHCSSRKGAEAQHEQAFSYWGLIKDSTAREQISILANEKIKYHGHRGRTEPQEQGNSAAFKIEKQAPIDLETPFNTGNGVLG